MKVRTFVASLAIAGFLSGMPALANADQWHQGSGDYDQHPFGIPAIGGWSIIQTGSNHLTQSGPGAATGTLIIIGTIATGGKNTTQIGRANIITIGTKRSRPILPAPAKYKS